MGRCFPMLAPVGDFGEPLARLAIDIIQIREAARGPEVLANTADAGPLHFSFLPTRGWIAGTRDEAELAREGEKARLKTYQPAIVFGDCGGQVGVPDFAARAAQHLESMHATAHEGLENFGFWLWVNSRYNMRL